MKSNELNPIKAEQFLHKLKAKLQPAQGTFIYEASLHASMEKTNPGDESGYVQWLRSLIEFLRAQPGVRGVRALDLGCGTGELTVLMRLIGLEAFGLDVHRADIQLAQLLAEENGFPKDMFIWSAGEGKLPFADASFDIVTMISVLEHLDEPTLRRLVPELARVCSGVVFAQAPSSASLRDDHTGLLFVPSLPHWLAKTYIAARGNRYRYAISASGDWDVHYRSSDEVFAAFGRYFDCNYAPADCSYPPVSSSDSVTSIGRHFQIANRNLYLGLPIPWRRRRINRGCPKEAYYPYLNLVCTPKVRANGSAHAN